MNNNTGSPIETKTFPAKFVNNSCLGKMIDTIDGSVSRDIVINSEDKEYVNEGNKLLDEEREAKREMYFRHSRTLYPEKEEWILSMAVDAYMEQLEKGVDITTYKFGSDEPSEKFDNLTVS